jgi:hypothetical protein
MPRMLIADLKGREMQPMEVKGWIRRFRETKSVPDQTQPASFH